MDTYLQAIGWWNFVGSFMMLGFLYEPFGKKMLNEWTKIFRDDFVLDYWGKLWLFWAAGLNIFFGLINIVAVYWGYEDVKLFLVYSDLIAYLIFIALAFWGLRAGRLGEGAYSVFIIFGFWLAWGVYAII
jgi:hypothetical protein